jgi:thymidylate synthase
MKNIPVLTVTGKTLAETYEKSIISLLKEGCSFKTQYDKVGDPLSVDATMNMTTLEPLTDPIIHKAFPGGLEDLREYVYELQGAKDSWIHVKNDPKDTRWEYTYHGRLAHWGQYKYRGADGIVTLLGENIDQVKIAIDKLCKQPFTRQAQMITWDPREDTNCYDPACLQSIWLRILEEDGVYWLNSNIRFRSNDAWNANLMNQFGFIMFIKNEIADVISERLGKEVKMGRLNWQADSYHIYGKDIENVRKFLINKVDAGQPFDKRVINFWDETTQEIYIESEKSIQNKIETQNNKIN